MGPSVEAAFEAYETLAPAYDELTAGHDHAHWLGEIDDRLRRLGLRGRRLLDVACGSGKSFAPMLARGYDVTACDLSPMMVALARARHPLGAERVALADMRSLPERLGRFDLVTCLDDSVNYLLSDEDLAAAFASAAAVLADGGLYVFDVNTRTAYARDFAGASITERADTLFCWRPRAQPAGTDGLFSVSVDAFQRLPGGRWRRTTSVHVQRHHDRAAVLGALERAQLECVAVLGQRRGGVLDDVADESRDPKLLYVARRRSSPDSDGNCKEVFDAHPRPVAGAAAGSRAAPGVVAARLAALAPPYGVRHITAPFA